MNDEEFNAVALMRAVLTEIARDVERTDVRDLHKLRALAVRALKAAEVFDAEDF